MQSVAFAQGRREDKKSPVQVTYKFNHAKAKKDLKNFFHPHVFMGPSSGHGPRYSVPPAGVPPRGAIFPLGGPAFAMNSCQQFEYYQSAGEAKPQSIK